MEKLTKIVNEIKERNKQKKEVPDISRRAVSVALFQRVFKNELPILKDAGITHSIVYEIERDYVLFKREGRTLKMYADLEEILEGDHFFFSIDTRYADGSQSKLYEGEKYKQYEDTEDLREAFLMCIYDHFFESKEHA